MINLRKDHILRAGFNVHDQYSESTRCFENMATVNSQTPSDNSSDDSEAGSSISEPDIDYDEEDVWEDGHAQVDSPSVVLSYQFEPAAEHRERAAHSTSVPTDSDAMGCH